MSHHRSLLRSKRLSILSVVLASALLGACGGGGGGNASPSAGGQSTDGSSISAANARQHAAMAHETVDSLALMGGMVADSPGAVKSLAAPGQFDLARMALERSRTLGHGAPVPGPASPRLKAAFAMTNACSGGGSATLTYDDADDDQEPSAGDRAVFAFADCVEDGARMNGRMAMTLLRSEYADSLGTGYESFEVRFEDLSLTEDGIVETANGGFTMTIAWRDGGNSYESMIRGQSLVISSPKNGSSLTDFTYSESGQGSRYTFEMMGILDSRLGTVTQSTPTPFRGTFGAQPSEGVMQLRAGDGSRVAVTALPAFRARLDVDSNGDGTTDSTEEVSWEELDLPGEEP